MVAALQVPQRRASELVGIIGEAARAGVGVTTARMHLQACHSRRRSHVAIEAPKSMARRRSARRHRLRRGRSAEQRTPAAPARGAVARVRVSSSCSGPGCGRAAAPGGTHMWLAVTRLHGYLPVGGRGAAYTKVPITGVQAEFDKRSHSRARAAIGVGADLSGRARVAGDPHAVDHPDELRAGAGRIVGGERDSRVATGR